MEENKKLCPYCGEEIMETAKKCRYCGEWLGEGKAEDSVSIEEMKGEGTERTSLKTIPKTSDSAEQPTDTETSEEESEAKKDYIYCIATVFFILAVIGSFVSTAYDEGFNLMDTDDIHVRNWFSSILYYGFVLAGKLPLWLGSAASVLGGCGLFVMLYSLLKSAGIYWQQSIGGIVIGIVCVNCVDSMGLLSNNEGGEVVIGLFGILATILLVVCMVIFGIKAFINRGICEFEYERNYLKYTGIICLGYVPIFIIALVMEMNDISKENYMTYCSTFFDIAMFYIIKNCVLQLSYNGYNIDDAELKKWLVPLVSMPLVVGGIGYFAEKHMTDTIQEYMENTDENQISTDSISDSEEENTITSNAMSESFSGEFTINGGNIGECDIDEGMIIFESDGSLSGIITLDDGAVYYLGGKYDNEEAIVSCYDNDENVVIMLSMKYDFDNRGGLQGESASEWVKYNGDAKFVIE